MMIWECRFASTPIDDDDGLIAHRTDNVSNLENAPRRRGQTMATNGEETQPDEAGCRPGRSAADEVLATAIATGQKIADCAKLAGVSESTAYARLRNVDFKDRVAEIRAAMVSAAVGRLSGTMADAAEVLAKLIESESETTRFRAADRLITHAIRVVEIEELQRRVEELEKRLQDREVGPSFEALKAKLLARGFDLDRPRRGGKPDAGQQIAIQVPPPGTPAMGESQNGFATR
jgi:hypothetical protein